MRSTLLFTIAALVAPMLAGCAGIGEIIGSGTSATEDRTVAAFTELTVGEAISATVTVGTPLAVRVTADDNVLSHVQTTISGSTLDVGMQGTFVTRTPVTVAITVPSLSSISASSAAVVTVTGLDAQALTVKGDSAGRITASGQATSLELNVVSGAAADLGQLAVGAVNATLESAGLATVNTSGAVTGRVSSAAVLTIQGSPTSVNVSTDSTGRVVQQ